MVRPLALLQPQKASHRHPEKLAHGDELVQLRHRGPRLPLAHRLPGHPQPVPQLLLGHSGSLPQGLYPFTQGHVSFPFLFHRIAERPPKSYHPPGSFCHPPVAHVVPQGFSRKFSIPARTSPHRPPPAAGTLRPPPGPPGGTRGRSSHSAPSPSRTRRCWSSGRPLAPGR